MELQLAPIHLAVLAVIKFYYLPLSDEEEYTREPSIALFELMLDYIYDLQPSPPSFESFRIALTQLKETSESELESMRHCIDSISMLFNKIADHQVDSLQRFFFKFKSTILTDKIPEDESVGYDVYGKNPIERRSPLGIFIRKCILSYSLMSFDQALELLETMAKWVEMGKNVSHTEDEARGITAPAPLVTDDRGTAYDQFMLAKATGHSLEAETWLKRFFDYRHANLNERGLHQHALLNLVTLYYVNGNYMLARNALAEATRLARQVGDKECLNACYGLCKRLDYYHPESKQLSKGLWSEDFATFASIDEFWLIKDGLANGEPTAHVFTHLYRTKALLLADTVGYRFDRFNQRWEATSAELWNLLGSPTLTRLHRDLSLSCEALEANRLAPSSKSSSIAAQSIALAHAGRVEEAFVGPLSLACGSVGWNCKNEFEAYSAAIWEVWRIRAERHGFEKILKYLEEFHQCPADNLARTTNKFGHQDLEIDLNPDRITTPPEDHVRFLLRRAFKLKSASQSALALQSVLEALSISDLPNVEEVIPNAHSYQQDEQERAGPGKSLVNLNTLARVMLADIEIELLAAAKAERDLIQWWPVILSSGDKELMALANRTRARAILSLATSDSSNTSTDVGGKALAEQSLTFFQDALECYRSIEHYIQERQVLSDLAVVYHLLGQDAKRDTMSQEWLDLQASKEPLEDVWQEEILEMESWLNRHAALANRIPDPSTLRST